MTKRGRTSNAGATKTKRDIPAEYAEEANIVPSATAVAAEALATGVVPLEAEHRHSEANQSCNPYPGYGCKEPSTGLRHHLVLRSDN